MEHITVLQREAVEALQIQPNSVIVDATLGAGGHAGEIIKLLGPTGRYIGIDADQSAIAHAQQRYGRFAQTSFHHTTFRHIDEVAQAAGLTVIDGILADLGWHTDQFTTHGRGFSFTDDSGLSMTYGNPEDYSFTAADIVNEWAEEDIANVLYGYGEERYARRIAKGIVAARAIKQFTTALALATVIKDSVPVTYRYGKTNPATKSFQALRIAVNDEFEELEIFLAKAFALLRPGGRLAVISFHSLEDRIVKLAFRRYTQDQNGVLVYKKPITPSSEELEHNPRARSAKLRIIEKVS